jgi:hypothetical protein
MCATGKFVLTCMSFIQTFQSLVPFRSRSVSVLPFRSPGRWDRTSKMFILPFETLWSRLHPSLCFQSFLFYFFFYIHRCSASPAISPHLSAPYHYGRTVIPRVPGTSPRAKKSGTRGSQSSPSVSLGEDLHSGKMAFPECLQGHGTRGRPALGEDGHTKKKSYIWRWQ